MFGTLAAVLVVYREAIGKLAIGGLSTLGNSQFWREPRTIFNTSTELKFIWLILLGTIPTGVIAVLFKSELESFFHEVRLVSIMLILTGVILQLPRLRKQDAEDSDDSTDKLKTWHAPLIGIAQGCRDYTRHLSFRNDNLAGTVLGDSRQNGCGILLFALNSRDTRCSCAENPRCRGHHHTTTHLGRGNARLVHCRIYRVAVSIGRAKPRQIFSVFLLLYCFRIGFALDRLNPISRDTPKDFLIVVAYFWHYTDTV